MSKNSGNIVESLLGIVVEVITDLAKENWDLGTEDGKKKQIKRGKDE